MKYKIHMLNFFVFTKIKQRTIVKIFIDCLLMIYIFYNEEMIIYIIIDCHLFLKMHKNDIVIVSAKFYIVIIIYCLLSDIRENFILYYNFILNRTKRSTTDILFVFYYIL